MWAFDHVSGNWKLKRVLQNFEREHDIDMVHVTIAGETIQSTMLHPYWVCSGKDLSDRPIRSHLAEPPKNSTVAGRWVDATDLRVGDRMLSRDGIVAFVEAVRHVPSDTTVYNFSVDELECYAVGTSQILVHNTNGIGGNGLPNPAAKAMSSEQQALIELAKEAKLRGRTSPLSGDDARTLLDWADEFGIPNRGPEVHPNRPFGQFPHIHIGPVNHIPVN